MGEAASLYDITTPDRTSSRDLLTTAAMLLLSGVVLFLDKTMAWTELHGKLVSHPKTSDLAAELGIPKYQAVGILTSMWCFALEHCQNGVILKPKRLAAFIGLKDGGEKEIAAMIKTEWIDEIDGELACHDWMDYAGRLEEYRERNREKQQRYRDNIKRNRNVTEDNRNVTEDNRNVTEDNRNVTDSNRVVTHSTCTLPVPVPVPVPVPTKNQEKNRASRVPRPAAPEWCFDVASRIVAHVKDTTGADRTSAMAKWAESLERLSRSKRFVPELGERGVKEIIAFAISDDFWRDNVLSPPNNDKAEKLRAAMGRKLRSFSQGIGGVET